MNSLHFGDAYIFIGIFSVLHKGDDKIPGLNVDWQKSRNRSRLSFRLTREIFFKNIFRDHQSFLWGHWEIFTDLGSGKSKLLLAFAYIYLKWYNLM